MKTNRVLSVILVVAVAATLASCEKIADNSAAVQSGTWSGGVFTNKWSNISFELPEGFNRLTDAEYYERTGDNAAQKAYNSGDGFNVAAGNVCDFWIISEELRTAFILVYENTDFDENGYLDAMMSNYEQTPGAAELSGTAAATIAGEQYLAATVFFPESGAYTQLYLRKTDAAMVCLYANYQASDAAADAVAAFVKSITPAKG
ncbi:MAG: hypothetical protein LBN00_04400 [Oscillospiraceae bacterium]|jgi:hypothetical protein|nr:hypothetical protein [Oscillospiraceae bacterium]